MPNSLAILAGVTPALKAARTAFNLPGVRETAAASTRLHRVFSDAGYFAAPLLLSRHRGLQLLKLMIV